MNKIEVLKLMGATRMLWSSWKDAPSTKEEASLMGDVWLTVLDDVPLGLAMAALQSLSVEGREFVPPVGVIRRHAILLRARQNGDLPPSVDEAWGEVRQHIVRHGRSEQPTQWSHSAVGEVVASIGWFELCVGQNADTVRAHFRTFYTEAVQRFERDLVLSDTMRASIQQAALIELVERTDGS